MSRILFIFSIAIIAAGCASGSSSNTVVRDKSPQAVVGKTWQWVSTVTPVDNITVPDPGQYTIYFGTDGYAAVMFDCNRGGGQYAISEGKLSFNRLISTRMACSPDSLDGPFSRDLQRVVSFFLENDSLYLELPVDSGTMKFLPQ